MDEIKRIKNYTNSEIPKGNKIVIRVTNISNSKEVLDNFKNAIIVFLKNSDINDEDKKWEKLLPSKIVNYIKQLDDEDYSNDDLLEDIDISIYSLQKRKEWYWYSSKELENGFEIIVEGYFHPRFVNFIHCQNVPLANIWIKDDKNDSKHNLRVYKDYTTYKTLK
jgi:hypothetical protein